MNIDPNQIWNNALAENGKFIKVNLPGSGLPNDEAYAILTFNVGDVNSSDLSSSPNTAYQDQPFNLQSTQTTSAQRIINQNKRGWMTITVETDTPTTVYVGQIGVTFSNGYKLNSNNPSVTVSSDDLSEWYCVGVSGGEKIYVVGAYIS